MLKWNVIVSDMNTGKIKAYNIFDHGSFCREIKDVCKEAVSKERFVSNVKSALLYYFWCKSEWEVIISPWCGNRENNERKVDVYWQVMNNFDRFIDYIMKEEGLDLHDDRADQGNGGGA